MIIIHSVVRKWLGKYYTIQLFNIQINLEITIRNRDGQKYSYSLRGILLIEINNVRTQ
jgi:hypothetical protein